MKALNGRKRAPNGTPPVQKVDIIGWTEDEAGCWTAGARGTGCVLVHESFLPDIARTVQVRGTFSESRRVPYCGCQWFVLSSSP